MAVRRESLANFGKGLLNLISTYKDNQQRGEFNQSYSENMQSQGENPDMMSALASMLEQNPHLGGSKTFKETFAAGKAMAPDNLYTETPEGMLQTEKRTGTTKNVYPFKQPPDMTPYQRESLDLRKQEMENRNTRAKDAAKERAQVKSTTDWRFLQSMKARLEADLSQLGEDATKYGNAPTTSDEDKEYFGMMRTDIEQQIAERKETYRMVLSRLGELKPANGNRNSQPAPSNPQGEAVYDYDPATGQLVPRKK